MPERSAGTVVRMVGEERRVSFGRRLLSARLAVALGVVALVLNVAALVLVASADQPAPQLVRATALLPTPSSLWAIPSPFPSYPITSIRWTSPRKRIAVDSR